eukprot:CAMPEP_0195302576 /NCGR_PEP_ID=MMETSP0707-20130614/31336_1 /TAXON_ID=33640 /ORGANISM="Asterionellopsis glacialis, Strain CCMP134" /LENGTH=39 /DNA_ID= /DNA_START= /DNA_END= /DNA_ORIENTATION=
MTIDTTHQSFAHDSSVPNMTVDSELYTQLRSSLQGTDDS